MRGEAATKQTFDPRKMLRATVEALGTMDTAALEQMRAEAEAMAARGTMVDGAAFAEAQRIQQALGELLRSTERSLRVLRGVHEASVRRAKEASWVR